MFRASTQEDFPGVSHKFIDQGTVAGDSMGVTTGGSYMGHDKGAFQGVAARQPHRVVTVLVTHH